MRFCLCVCFIVEMRVNLAIKNPHVAIENWMCIEKKKKPFQVLADHFPISTQFLGQRDVRITWIWVSKSNVPFGREKMHFKMTKESSETHETVVLDDGIFTIFFVVVIAKAKCLKPHKITRFFLLHRDDLLFVEWNFTTCFRKCVCLLNSGGLRATLVLYKLLCAKILVSLVHMCIVDLGWSIIFFFHSFAIVSLAGKYILLHCFSVNFCSCFHCLQIF